MKKIFYLMCSFFVLGGIILILLVVNSKKNQPSIETNDFRNTSYIIDGQVFHLKNGMAETEIAPGSTSHLVTKYFGNELAKDLDGDGRDDVVFLVTQESGGSGTFFYVVGALHKESGYVGSHALFLGDRISPQTTESGPGMSVVVNFAERANGEPMTTPPSEEKSLRLTLDPTSMEFRVFPEDTSSDISKTNI